MRRTRRAVRHSVHSRVRPDSAAPERQRLLVIGPTTAEVVEHAGGWLCDRVMSGWECVVVTLEHEDARPLRILGATAVGLAEELAAPGRVPQAVAVEVNLCGADDRGRHLVRRAIAQGATDVRRWGDCAADTAVDPVPYRPSHAARAFKAHAVAAVAAVAAVGAGLDLTGPRDPAESEPEVTEEFREQRPPRAREDVVPLPVP